MRERRAAKLPAQFVLDLAVDALELRGEVLHQHFQAPLAAVHDLPEFGALVRAEPFVGQPDSRLDDVAAPRFCARGNEFGRYFWHALVPRRAASGDTMPRNGTSFRRVCGMVNARVDSGSDWRGRLGLLALAGLW